MLRLLGHGAGTPKIVYEFGVTEYVRCVLKLSDRCLGALDLGFPIFCLFTMILAKIAYSDVDAVCKVYISLKCCIFTKNCQND